MTVIPLDPDGHGRVRALLPWYVNGRLDDNERAEVEAHLAGCSRCRSELVLERELHALHDVLPLPEADPEGRFADLRRRLEAPSAPVAAPRPRWPWWTWVLGLESGLVLLLALLLLVPPRGETPAYRGQGAAPPAASANAVVMFAPETTEAQWRQALKSANARLVGGPTATRGYLLHLPQADDATLARLRAQPGVTLAEPLAAGDTP